MTSAHEVEVGSCHQLWHWSQSVECVVVGERLLGLGGVSTTEEEVLIVSSEAAAHS